MLSNLSNIFSYITIGFYILNLIWAFYVVFYEKKTPGVIWAWLLVLFLLPGIGFLFYLVFGFEGRKHKRFAQKALNDEILFNDLIKLYPDALDKNLDNKDYSIFKDAEYLKDLVTMNRNSCRSPYRTNNSVKTYHEGVEKFKDLLNDIEKAKTYIHMEYYLMHDDHLGMLIMEALTKKAKEGVEVKLMYDGMGNAANVPGFRSKLKKAGGEAKLFLPPRGIRINYRDHRKIAVIDGKIGYVGGLNIGDEYVSKARKFGFWRDSHIRVEGDAVKDLELRFMMDWNFTKGRKLKIEPKYFPDVEYTGNINMQIISSGPDCKWDSIQYTYFKMINEANKRIYIATPYFVPDDSILEALRTAALSGVDVRVIIPANPDHPFVYYGSINYIGELMDAGVKCYEYTKGFIHSKVMTIDGLVTSVGTANMDIRSFKLNFEVNAIIYDKEITKEFDRQFNIDFNDCMLLTKEIYENKGRITRFKEAVARLISPLL